MWVALYKAGRSAGDIERERGRTGWQLECNCSIDVASVATGFKCNGSSKKELPMRGGK